LADESEVLAKITYPSPSEEKEQKWKKKFPVEGSFPIECL
jgi:hypothetical protein